MNLQQFEKLKNREECTLANDIYICSKKNIVHNVPMFRYKDIWFFLKQQEPTEVEDLELAFDQQVTKEFLVELLHTLQKPDVVQPTVSNYTSICSVWQCMNYENSKLF